MSASVTLSPPGASSEDRVSSRSSNQKSPRTFARGSAFVSERYIFCLYCGLCGLRLRSTLSRLQTLHKVNHAKRAAVAEFCHQCLDCRIQLYELPVGRKRFSVEAQPCESCRFDG